jgi:restriction endonuclease S subunit
MYPPIELINQFTDIVKPMDEQIELLTEQNENLIKTRNLLLPA